MQEIDVRGSVAASPAAVWALLDDSSTWPDWTSIDRHENVAPRGADGLGEERRFVNGRVTVVERIVERRPEQRLTYVLLSGLPVRDYRAEIDLTPEGDGTAVRWHTTFTGRIPGTGWFYRLVLQAATKGFVKGLAAAAAR